MKQYELDDIVRGNYCHKHKRLYSDGLCVSCEQEVEKCDLQSSSTLEEHVYKRIAYWWSILFQETYYVEVRLNLRKTLLIGGTLLALYGLLQ